MDITESILHDHYEQRRMFALLDELDEDSLGPVWDRLAVLLEVHAAAEELLFYPALLEIGHGEADSETRDAIKDHNEIRDAVAGVARHRVGSGPWRKAVRAARKANSDHMAEEERDDLADFRRRAGLQLRHDLAVAFAGYEARHATGIEAHDRDPDRYVEQHS